jgi:hypothetical protein
MDYPTDHPEGIAKAYLYPISPDLLEDIPHHFIECDIAGRLGAGLRFPRYRFMALFSSVPLEAHLAEPQPSEGDASFLTIIWLQDEPFPFVSEENKILILALDWLTLAKNGNW